MCARARACVTWVLHKAEGHNLQQHLDEEDEGGEHVDDPQGPRQIGVLRLGVGRVVCVDERSSIMHLSSPSAVFNF